MAGLSFPPDDVLPDGRAAPGNRLDQAHRMFEEEAGLAADEAAGCMPSLDARTFMQEDDLLVRCVGLNPESSLQSCVSQKEESFLEEVQADTIDS